MHSYEKLKLNPANRIKLIAEPVILMRKNFTIERILKNNFCPVILIENHAIFFIDALGSTLIPQWTHIAASLPLSISNFLPSTCELLDAVILFYVLKETVQMRQASTVLSSSR